MCGECCRARQHIGVISDRVKYGFGGGGIKMGRAQLRAVRLPECLPLGQQSRHVGCAQEQANEDTSTSCLFNVAYISSLQASGRKYVWGYTKQLCLANGGYEAVVYRECNSIRDIY